MQAKCQDGCDLEGSKRNKSAPEINVYKGRR